MKPMRSTLLAMLTVALASVPVRAQVGVGGHMVRAMDAFGETGGAGLRVQLGLPLVPVSLAVNGEYFFARCPDVDCKLYGTTFDLNWSLPVPLLQPFVGVGWSVREVATAGRRFTERGINVGAGAQFRLTGFRPYVDVRYEMADAPEKQFVVRMGFMFR